MARTTMLLISLLLAPWVVGCAAGICDRPERSEPTVFSGGERVGNTYKTSDFDGDLLHFPGGAYYRIEHQLGEVPTGVNFLLSFKRDGVISGTVAAAAGNQVEMDAIDDTSVTVLNGSCSDYFLIVQAWLEDDDAGGGGMGGGGMGGGGMGGGGGN